MPWRARTEAESAARSSLARAIAWRPSRGAGASCRWSPSLRAMPTSSTSNPMRRYAAIPAARSATPMVTWSMRVRMVALLRLDLRSLHDVAHALQAVLRPLRDQLGLRADRLEALGDQLLAHVGRVHGLDHPGVQPLDDRVGRGERHDGRRPGAPPEPGHARPGD